MMKMEAARRLEGEMMCYTDKEYFFLDVMIKAEQKNNVVPSPFKNEKKWVTDAAENGIILRG